MADTNENKMLTLDIINEYTREEVEREISYYERQLYGTLMPELNMQMAVQEAQRRQQGLLSADIDIANLASEFVYRLKGAEFEKALSCFALQTPGVSAEISACGVYEGEEKLRAYFVDYLNQLVGKAGTLKYVNLCSPVIEVAADGLTGRGMWLTVGMESWDRPDLKETYNDPVSLWEMGTWCMDFVREDGVWKIWHLYIFGDIETVYEESWTESADHKIPTDPRMPVPSRPSDRDNPFTGQRRPVLHARPPVPYASYDTADSF